MPRKGHTATKNSKRTRRRSKKPASIATAVVRHVNDNGQAVLDIDGQPKPFTLSKRQSNKFSLEADNKLVVIFKPVKHGLEVIVSEKYDDAPPSFLVKYAGPDKKKLVMDNDRVKRQFSIAAGSIAPEKQENLFTAELPHNYDPRNPALKIVSETVSPDDKPQDTEEKVLQEKGVQKGFTVNAEAEARKLSYSHVKNNPAFSAYKDRTDLPFITIDPPQAKDLDDAICILRTDEGFSVLKAITDVPALIHTQSLLDKEAFERGLTHYIPGGAIHMLPASLSESKFSLLRGKERPVILVEHLYDENKQLLKMNVEHAIIRSCAKLDYSGFNEYLKHKPELFDIYHDFNEAALSGPLPSDTTVEDILKLRKNSGINPDKFVSARMNEANQGLASLLDAKKIPFIYRVNGPKATPDAYKKARTRLAELGYAIPADGNNFTNEALAKLVEEARTKGDSEAVFRILNQKLVDRHAYATSNVGHQALSVDCYGHFTSPIRRYSDIVNLRAVHTLLGQTDFGLKPYDYEHMEETAYHLNHLREIERLAKKEYTKEKSVEKLKSSLEHEIEMIVLDVGKAGMNIVHAPTGLRSYVPFNNSSGVRAVGQIEGLTDTFRLYSQESQMRDVQKNGRITGKLSGISPKGDQLCVEFF
ncbi:MAG: hypothetical protein CL565_03345 [Alphaproteobacteria bacterium]|nr:hypothetical protein [Alphaproteobacteria bacterium]|tara:strand:+ start:1060 stop:2994 length:1935 start_codon:yes stop_codon:yes gene_type:complete